MIDDYRFFNDFYDGQIVKKESQKYKLFKLMLVSVALVIGIFLVLADFSYPAELLLLGLGIVWNLYAGLSKKFSLLLSLLVAFLYLIFCSGFGLYANAFIYLAVYIPFQLIAVVKDYGSGDFVQVRKKMTDYNKILFIIFFLFITAVLCLFDVGLGSRFALFDGIASGLLVCSALLRNERYLDYYIFRIAALLMSIALWVQVAIEFGTYGTIMIIIMYAVYLVYDASRCFYDQANYVNEYMVATQDFEKEQDKVLVEEKVKEYQKMKNTKKVGTK